MQKNLSKYYRSKSADILCEQFNKFINRIKKEKEETKDKYPWLDQGNERRNMSEKEILDKYVDYEKSCQIQKRNKSWICYINIKILIV